MLTVEVRNLQDMWHRLCGLVLRDGVMVETRNGPALEYPGQVMIKNRAPRERVLYDPDRNCNHVFHLMESIWMLAGRQDVAFPQQFNSNIATYSDDGAVFHAAYGHRWRSHFGVDQVGYAINALKENPNDRRVVISMWDANADGNGVVGKDFPCNMMIIPKIWIKKDGPTAERGPHLDFTIINRSNDLVWGLCGANAVHMTILQEYIACALGARVGHWYHFTNNLHVYEKHIPLIKGVVSEPNTSWASYAGVSSLTGQHRLPPMVANHEVFLQECIDICNGKTEGFSEPFLEETVEPVWASWREWKAGNHEEAMEIALCIDAFDWRKGVVEWYRRAINKRGLK